MGVEQAMRGKAGPAARAGEWTVLRSLRWPGRWFPSVVRVLVGPAGVFVIAAHPTAARVSVDAREVRLDGHPDIQCLTDVTDAALVVAQHAGPYAAHVQPVLCFTSTPVTLGRAGDVLCTSVLELVAWLTRRPAVLGGHQVDDVVVRLRAALGAEVDCRPARDLDAQHGGAATSPPVPAGARATAAAPHVRVPGLRALPGAVSSAGRRVARGGLITKFVVLTVVTLALLAYGPGALNPVGAAFGRWFSDATTPATCPAAGPAAGTASGLPSRPGAGSTAESTTQSETDLALRAAQAQLTAQWTMNRQAVAEAAQPLCRPDR